MFESMDGSDVSLARFEFFNAALESIIVDVKENVGLGDDSDIVRQLRAEQERHAPNKPLVW